jgi:uncharacterized coiled-coil protein SlyX
MAYITHVEQVPYYNTQSGWYNGWFRGVADAYGKVGEYMYYRDMEAKASFAKQLCGIIPLVGGAVGDFFVSMFRNVYNNQQRAVYLDWAASACKIFEQFQSKIEQTYTDMTNAINNAKAYVQSNLINPILNTINNDLKPKLTQAMTDLNNFASKIDGFTKNISDFKLNITQFQSLINNMQAQLDAFAQKYQDVIDLADQASARLQTIEGEIANLSDVEDALKQKIVDDENLLNNHADAINNLIDRVSALEGKTSGTDYVEKVKEYVGKLKWYE